MTQFQQKLESQEFLPSANVLSWGEAARGSDLTIRLWRKRPESAPLGWQTESVLIYMIVDLIAASGGRIDESSGMMTARFASPGHALVAAQRIQTSIFEFLACRAGDFCGAAVLVHSPLSEPHGSSGERILGALEWAQPGQILLAAGIASLLRGIPGVDLREVPALATGANEPEGLTELLWIPPGRMAELRAASERVRRDDDSSMGATLLVDTRLTGRTGSRGTGPPGMGALPGAEPTSEADSRAVEQRLETGRGPMNARPFFLRATTLIAVAAVAFVGVAVAVFYPAHNLNPPPHGQASPANPKEKGSGQVLETTTQPGMVAPQVPEASVPPPLVVKATSPIRPAPDKPTRNPGRSKDNPSAAAPAVEIQGFEGMTQADIPRLLQFAKADAGNGNYGRAGKEYQVILRLQPNNAAAREGLRKLEIAQSDR
jgi:hypothetical protein